MAVDIPKEQPAREMTPVSETPWEVTKRSTNADLNLLKDKVQEGKIDEVIDAVINVATENNGKIPEEKIAEFLNTLDVKEKQLLMNYLTGDDMKGKLGDLKSAVEKTVPPSTAKRVMGFINEKVESLGLGEKMNQITKKFGFDGVGDQMSFMKNFLYAMSAKIIESIAFSMKSFSQQFKKMLETPMELRMATLGIVLDSQKEIFRQAYLYCAKKAKDIAGFTPPIDIDDAKEIVAKIEKEQSSPNAQTISVTLPSQQKPETTAGDAKGGATENKPK